MKDFLWEKKNNQKFVISLPVGSIILLHGGLREMGLEGLIQHQGSP